MSTYPPIVITYENGQTRARIARLTDEAPAGSIDALENLLNGKPMFDTFALDTGRSAARRRIVRFLCSEKLVHRVHCTDQRFMVPATTALGRKFLAATKGT